MDAITMLTEEHRTVEQLFVQLAQAKSSASRRMRFEEIADALAVHSAIEERHFYPAVKEKQTEDLLVQSLEEHLEIKQAIADLLELDPQDDTFDAKVKALEEEVEHHVEKEEEELFPVVERLFDDDALELLAAVMKETRAELVRDGGARETENAAPI